MIYSKTCEYAMRALQYLAEQKRGEFILTKTVGEATGIPQAYLAKIFQDLVRHDILSSRRGAAGGVALKKNPESISLKQVMEIIDDPEHFNACVMGLDRCANANPCPLHHVWKKARQNILSEMQTRTLASLTKNIGKVRYRDLNRGRLNAGLKLKASD